MSNALLNHYAEAEAHPNRLFITTSKGFDPQTPHTLTLDDARTMAKKILDLDCGEHWVDIYCAEGKNIERIERSEIKP
jgi:hypothetical protein